MPFLLAEILNFQGSTHHIGVGSFSQRDKDFLFSSLHEYSCAMKSHFRKIGNQMSGSGNHLCEFTRVMFYLDRIPLASICHVQHQCL